MLVRPAPARRQVLSVLARPWGRGRTGVRRDTSAPDEQDRPLFLVVTIRPRKDRLAEAEAQLQSMRRNTLTEPGCVFMHLVQPQDDPDSWVMLEMFRSRAAWDEHMRQPYNTEGNVLLEDRLREPSELRLFDEK
ncbi:putative quinol monooxygenase [Cellulomonas sp. URHD0024]|uniref:putative quinol monooxygenase n=1 Tax=Cellulomonas sp. URHD0024 TaxID=1302620 RepID=UPI0018C94EE6|nr:putative quinol monooxygenase [Cellulomonas sp. URHD0024]